MVITPAGKEFITPVTLSSLSGKPVVSEFFTANTGEWHSHVDLGLWADLMVIAPAIADNMLVTTYLSAKEHVMIAPAMDLDMMAHPSTVRNLATLESYGVEIIEPAAGELASHLMGKGRMEEPENIFSRIERFFMKQCDMLGKKVAIIASGKMGFALAEECAARGAEVTLVCGPVSLQTANPNIHRIDVESAEEMLEASREPFANADMGIFAAAVADYRPESRAESKLKREGVEEMSLRLVKNPDIAATLASVKREGQLFVGFALETDNAHANALGKLRKKNLDMVVLNSLQDKGAGFGTDTNKVTILRKDGTERSFPLKSKREVAADIIAEILS